MAPRVSIIVPCFNQGMYLPRAVQSVIDQKYSNLEIVLIDDGSTDDTPSAIATLRSKYTGLVVTERQDNQGLSMARQAGLDRATGEYVVFLDADDYLSRGMVKTCVDAFAQYPMVSAAVGKAEIVFEGHTGAPHIMGIGRNTYWPDILSSNPYGACCSMMLKRADILRAGGVGISGVRACEDWDLYVRMACHGMTIQPMPHVLSTYVQREGVLSRNITLMLREKIALLDRMTRLHTNITSARPVSTADAVRFRNGYVLYAVGEAAGCVCDFEFYKALLDQMVGGDVHYRYLVNQFTYGLQHSMELWSGLGARKLAQEYIEEVCRIVEGRFLLHDFGRYAYMFTDEIRREMKEPFKRYSIRRRFERMLDPMRRFWIIPRQGGGRGRDV